MTDSMKQFAIPGIAPIADHDEFCRLPKADGLITRLAYARAVDAGIDPEPLLKEALLTVAQIENRRARIKVSDQMKFVDLMAHVLKDPVLGFNLASEFELREMGLLYYVMASSEHLGEALQRAQRYCAIANEGILLSYREGKDAVDRKSVV